MEYTRALHVAAPGAGSPGDIDRFLTARATRQELLVRPDLVRLWAIVGEAALRQEVGGPNVMRDQLKHLIQAAELDNVTIQVLSFGAGAHASVNGPFVILEFPDLSDWDVISVGTLGGTLYLEDEADIRRFNEVFDHLQASALPEGESLAVIRQISEDLE